MLGKVGHEDSASRDGVYEFKRKKLTGANETTIILVDKIEGKYGEEVGEGEVDGEIGICVTDKVKPVAARERECGVGSRSPFIENSGMGIY